MTNDLKDHNDGQKDGATATFLDCLAVEWNPLLSTAYKQGFRHAVQQQSEKRVQEEEARQRAQEQAAEAERRSTNKDEDDDKMPWPIALLLLFYGIILGGAFLALRWTVQRPWRVAVAFVIAGIVAFAVSRDQPISAASQNVPTEVVAPPADEATPASNVAPHAAEQSTYDDHTSTVRADSVPEHLQITAVAVGPVRLGMTVAQARAALPHHVFERTTDGEGMALIAVTGEDLEMILYAGEEDSESPIEEQARLQVIYVYGSAYATAEGVGPGMRLSEVEKRLGRLAEITMSEIEMREYAEFTNQPTEFSFRVGLPEGGVAGEYSDGQRRTSIYVSSAAIRSVEIGGYGDEAVSGSNSAEVQSEIVTGVIVEPEVLLSDEGLRIGLASSQEGGCPFYGVGHSGEINWDLKIGDRLQVVGTVFPLDDDSRGSFARAPFVKQEPTHGALADQITILSRE